MFFDHVCHSHAGDRKREKRGLHKLEEEGEVLECKGLPLKVHLSHIFFNSVHPNISIHVIHTNLCKFPAEMEKREFF